MSKDKPNSKAIALLYDQKSAPRVIAKGDDQQAVLIRNAAELLGIPQIENSALAESLMQLEIDESIPEELFVSVAVVLSWAYWLMGKTPDKQ
jgi:type III secretion system FlhB-like substrate exporter